MTLASNEQVPERRGGQGDPAGQPGRLDPLAAQEPVHLTQASSFRNLFI